MESVNSELRSNSEIPANEKNQPPSLEYIGEKLREGQLWRGPDREKEAFIEHYYPKKQHSFIYPLYNLLLLIYDGIQDVNELKHQMKLVYSSSSINLIMEEEDIEENMQVAKKKGLLYYKNTNELSLTPDGIRLAQSSYEQTYHMSYWMGKILREKAILIMTACALLFLAAVKLSIGYSIASAGMISEGAENLTDLIKIGIIFYGMKRHQEKKAGFLIILMMMITGVTLTWSGIQHLLTGNLIQPTIQSILITIFSIGINSGLMMLKGMVGRNTGNLSILSDSKDSEINVKISAGVLVGLIFATFGYSFVDSLLSIFIGGLCVKEGIEFLLEMKDATNDDISKIKVRADKIYEDHLTGYIFGTIRREPTTEQGLLAKFSAGLQLGRRYYLGFADYFYDKMGPETLSRHLDQMKNDKLIEKLDDEQLIITEKGRFEYYKARANEFKSRAKLVRDTPSNEFARVFWSLFWIIGLILLLVYADVINSRLFDI